MTARWGWLLGAFLGGAFAQTLDNRSLAGRYYFRHLFQAADETRSLLGALTFDGNGGYTFTGQQNVGSAAASVVTGSGTYTVSPAGMVAMTNPARPSLVLNARLGTGALVGFTTETIENIFDLIVAVPAPVSAASLSGTYWAAGFELGSLRNSFFLLRSNGLGGFLELTVSGHAAGRQAGAPFNESVRGGTYLLSADGSGTATFPGSALLASNKLIYLSRDGNILLGGSTAAGAHDLLIAIKAMPGSLSNLNWKDRFWGAGLRLDGRTWSAFAGAAAADGAGKLVWSQRVRQTGSAAIDFTGAVPYVVNSDGSGRALAARTAIGAAGDAFLGSTVAAESPGVYELYLGVRMPAVSGTGVFLNPQGVVNTASFAPVGAAVSPGQFVGLFGSGLAPRSETAQSTTFPTTLAGVSVLINNVTTPLYFVSPTQISALVPFATQGPRASIVVNNNGTRSNAVEVSVAATSPGVFSLSQTGTGLGAVLHADFGVVNYARPARRGEILLVFLTGLGAVSPAVADGAPGPANPLSRTTQLPTVRLGGRVCELLYSGLAPGFAGLYQLNIRVPSNAPLGTLPLSIETAEHFTDMVDVPVVP